MAKVRAIAFWAAVVLCGLAFYALMWLALALDCGGCLDK